MNRPSAATIGAALLIAALCAPAATPARAQFLPRPKICLVLSGGGARGVAHVGVIKVLEEQRIPIDCIVGTSMGSIVGGAYASGLSPELMESQIRAVDWDRVLADNPPRPARSIYTKQQERLHIGSPEVGFSHGKVKLPRGAIVGHQLELFLQGLIGVDLEYDSFDHLPIPFRAIATDIGNGQMVVLDKGSLAMSMRASMSVPGVFAPQKLDGRLLVDGGLVRNLGVDVARGMGADVVIAVNLGSGLLKPDDVQSIFSVAEQTLAILTEQNVQRSLAELKPTDILIEPALGDFSSSDFQNSMSTIPIGEAAARTQIARLQALSLDPEAYRQWQLAARHREEAPRFAAVRLDTSRLDFVAVPPVKAWIDEDGGIGRGNPNEIHDTLDRLLATDNFELVRLRPELDDGVETLSVEPTAKSWGPNYLRFGLNLATNFDGQGAFNLLVDSRQTWLTPSGLEWRNRLSIGQTTGIYSELRQPLEPTADWQLAPYLSIDQQLRNYFYNQDNLATYRERSGEGGLDLVRNIGTVSEVRLGYSFEGLYASQIVGTDEFGNENDRIGALHLLWNLDTFDQWNFPRSGYFAQGTIQYVTPDLGGNQRFDKLYLNLERALGGPKTSVILDLQYGKALSGSLNELTAFQVGGTTTLSAYLPGEFLTSEYLLGKIVYQRQIASPGGPFHAVYVGGSLEGASMREILNSPNPTAVIFSGSLFVAADTALGAFYFGTGIGEGGAHTLYLYLGRPGDSTQ